MQYGRKQSMVNKIYRDQIARRISPALSSSKGFQDVEAAEKALEWMIAYITSLLAECPQTSETGLCDMTWRHDVCASYMSVLYDLTKNDKYIPKYSWD